MSDYPDIRIECPDGVPWKTTVTVNGVMIPCTKITWTAEMHDVTRCVLEVPKVAINATVHELLVKYTEPAADTPEP